MFSGEVILVLGQSNAANESGQRYESAFGNKILNYFMGKCYQASSPLLGSTGVKGESWTLLANKMLKSNLASEVLLVPAAISGTPISNWSQGGRLNQMVKAVVADLKAHNIKPTRVIWQQGESDFGSGTTKAIYIERFHSLVATLRESGVSAPVYVSVSTAGEYYDGWFKENPAAQALRSLPDRQKSIFQGVDTDTLISFRDRFDGVHFSGSGQEKFTDAWLKIFQQEK